MRQGFEIPEGLKIATIPCAGNDVAPFPVHRMAPAARDSPLPLLSDDDDKDDNDNDDTGNVRTVRLLYLQSCRAGSQPGDPPPAALGRSVSCVGKWR